MFFSLILHFIDSSHESAIDIHRNAREILDKYELDIQVLTAVVVDNTKVNMEEYRSVFSLVRS